MFGQKRKLAKRRFETSVDPKSLPVIVYRTEWDSGGGDLVYGVVRYVNLLFEEGLYAPQGLKPKLMQCYHTDLYLAQVNNGGHSQYTGNGRPHLEDTNANVALGLRAMGASIHDDIFTRYRTWLVANSRLAQEQTGFGDIPDFLKSLDSEFYKAPDLSDLNAAWIQRWDDVILAEDVDDYRMKMQVLFQSNPDRDAVRISREIRSATHSLTSPQELGLAIAGSQQPGFVLTRLSGGGQVVEDDDGNTTAVFPAECNALSGSTVTVHHMTRGVVAVVHQAGEQTIMGKVSNETLETLIRMARELAAGPALHLLASRAGLDLNSHIIVPQVGDGQTYSVRLLDHNARCAGWMTLNAGGAVLTGPAGREQRAKIGRQDIVAHAARAQ